MCSAVTTLIGLLERALEKCGGSKQALADVMGISRPRVSRLLNGSTEYEPGILPCFKLAAFLREDELQVLRLASKGWLADLLESRQRKSVMELLTADQRSILDDFDVVAAKLPKAADRLRELLSELATEARRKLPKRGTKKKKAR